MTSTLNRFGSFCRDLRAQRGETMAGQAKALGYQVSHISAIETGKKIPNITYVDQFSRWLSLNPTLQTELRRRIPRNKNVISFPRKKDVSSTVKLFRKISKMTPAEIRALRKDYQDGGLDD